MKIAGEYENGVFKPLEEVNLSEGTRVEGHVRDEDRTPGPRCSVRDLPILGMWADRDHIPDGVTYVNRLRAPDTHRQTAHSYWQPQTGAPERSMGLCGTANTALEIKRVCRPSKSPLWSQSSQSS